MSIVAGLVEVLEEKARQAGATRVTAVRLRVGEMAGVVPELLTSAFEIYRKGTIAEGAVLEIEVVPVRPRCRSCGGTSWREEGGFLCVACGSRDLEIVEGRELILERLEVEVDEEPPPGRPAGGRRLRGPRRSTAERERA